MAAVERIHFKEQFSDGMSDGLIAAGGRKDADLRLGHGKEAVLVARWLQMPEREKYDVKIQ